MKRPLHPETRVQGEQGAEVPDCPYEPTDVPPRALGWTAIGFFILFGASVAGVLAATSLMSSERPPPFGLAAEHPQPPLSHLQAAPERDRAATETRATRALAADDPASPARLNIDNAMDRVARQGWADPEQPAPSPVATATRHLETAR